MKKSRARNSSLNGSSSGVFIPLLTEEEESTKRDVEFRRSRLIELAQEQASIPKRWSLQWWKSLPYFIIFVTLIDITMLCVSIYINGGLEPWRKNPLFGPSPDTLKLLGAKDVPLIHEGQWWRLVTPIFLHVGIIHLAANMWFQIMYASQIERGIGATRMAVIYLVAGIGGNLLSSVFLPRMLSAGASGALFGIMGCQLATNFKNWGAIDRPCCSMTSILITVVINLAIGLLPMVDNFCHLGGLITGFSISGIILPHLRKVVVRQIEPIYLSTYTSCKNICYIVVCLSLLAVFFTVGFVLFFMNVDMHALCPWCMDINCIPVFDLCNAINNPPTSN